jgi:hypothetical protein
MADIYGFDTASYIYSVASAAKSKYGTPSFWIRYFKPTITGGTPDQNFTTAGKEMQALRVTSGARYLAPLSAPGASRESTNSYAYGQNDAATFAASIERFAAYDPCTEYGIKIFGPNSSYLYVYLDVEASTVLNQNYWNGWSTYIYNYAWKGGGNFAALPLYPGIYLNPVSSKAPCNVIKAANTLPIKIWTNQPEPYCTCCGKFGSVKWSVSGPKNCSGYTSFIWQQAERGICITNCGASSTLVNVDIDELNPSNDSRDYMFYIDDCA